MKRRIVLMLALGTVIALAPVRAQSANVTPPPLKSVNSDQGLWSATGLYIDISGGNFSGGGVNYEIPFGADKHGALMFGALGYVGSFSAGGFGSETSVDLTSLIASAGYKYTLRPSRVYADDGTVVDAQIGAAAFGTASYLTSQIDIESCSDGFLGYRCTSRSSNDGQFYALAGIMADVPLGRHFSFRPHAEFPLGLDGAEVSYGVDLAVLGGLTDSWEISLSSAIQAASDNGDATTYTFTFTRKLGRN